jgi:iron complex outermembrane recepter protein
MANTRIRHVVHGLLAASVCLTGQAALAAQPVANEVHAWNIPAEDGPAAVRDFGIQSGVAISAVQTDLQGKRLNAVTGSMSVDSALRLLVAGTGLKYVYDATGRAVTLTAASSPAPAQKTPANTTRDPPATSSEPPSRVVILEEIVVTARKRSEDIQEVPISAEIVSGQTLADYNIKTLGELSQTIPGIQLNGTSAGGQFFIRGVGSGTSFTFDQSVGTFIDDIFHGRTRIADEAFLDLDRIEVLKGPQSTYFGSNAVAGALNIVTAKPTTDAFGGSVRALYGQYGQYAGEGMLNIPLSSDLAVRIAAIGDGLSGWAQDPYAGHKQPDQNNKAGRITFLYQPTEAFDATLKIEGGDNEESDGSVIGDCPAPAPFVTATGAAASGRFCTTALTAHYPVGLNNFEDTTNAGQGLDLSTFEDALTLHYHLGDDTLTSVTGFYNYHFTENLDADGTPQVLLNQQTKEFYHQFSQELRIASPQGGTLEWLAGLYLQNDHLTGNAGNLTYYFDTPTIKAAKADAALLNYLPLATYGLYNQAEHSYAAFASLDWNVTDRLKVGAGLRGSWVYKSASQISEDGTGTQPYGGVVPLPPNLQALAQSVIGTQKPAWSASDSYNSGMPSAEIDYKIAPSMLVYATYARGFLAGTPTDVGYVQLGIPTPPILPEHVNAYEAGFKSNLFGDHLRLNLDVFRSNYTNLQVSSSTIVTSATGTTQAVSEVTNAGSSRTQGVELSGEWVYNGFRFQTAVTYLNARYLSYPGVTLTAAQTYCHANPKIAACVAEFPSGVGLLQDLSGQPTSFAPTWSGNVTASYSVALPRGYHFITETDVYASTDYFFGNNGTDDPEQMQPGYARLDGRLSLESPDAHWAVDVVLKNLTDKVIILGGAGGTALPASNGSTLLQIDQPRNVAVQGRYKW